MTAIRKPKILFPAMRVRIAQYWKSNYQTFRFLVRLQVVPSGTIAQLAEQKPCLRKKYEKLKVESLKLKSEISKLFMIKGNKFKSKSSFKSDIKFNSLIIAFGLYSAV